MSAHDITSLRAAGEALVRTLIASPFVRPDGLLTRGLGADGAPNSRHCLADLGDYLPFFPLFGGEAFVGAHLAAVERALPDGLLSSQERRAGIPVHTSYEYTDLLQGLFWAAERDPAALSLARCVAERAIRLFRIGRGTCSVVAVGLPLRLSVLDTRDGMFLELLAGRKEVSGSTKAVAGLRDELLAIPAFRAHGLFPMFASRGAAQMLPRLRRAAETYVFMKHNSNAAYGFLALAKRGDTVAHAALDRWTAAFLKEGVGEDGSVVHRARFTASGLADREELATSTHTAIDLLCDISDAFDRQDCLTAARRIADRALAGRGRTGLFPLRASQKDDDLDVQTDMIVALHKLHELSGSAVYADAARVALEAVLTYHRRQEALVLSVDVDTGEVCDGSLKTKFIALFLKALHLALTEKRIYADPALHALIADR